MVVFKIKLATLKRLVGALKPLVDWVPLCFDKSRLRIFSMDSAHVVLVDCFLPPSYFALYYCGEPVQTRVKTSELFRILSTRANPDSLVTFALERGKHFATVYVHDEANGVSTCYDIQVDDAPHDAPHDELGVLHWISDIEVVMPSRVYRACLMDMIKCGSIGLLRLLPNGAFTFVVETRESKPFAATMSGGHLLNEKSKMREQSISVRYMRYFVRRDVLAENVRISMLDDYPLRVDYAMEGGATVAFYLAPRFGLEKNDPYTFAGDSTKRTADRLPDAVKRQKVDHS